MVKYNDPVVKYNCFLVKYNAKNLGIAKMPITLAACIKIFLTLSLLLLHCFL